MSGPRARLSAASPLSVTPPTTITDGSSYRVYQIPVESPSHSTPATPADGSPPRMQMYLWNPPLAVMAILTTASSAHEYGHGISNRLTGGPSQVSCLGNTEQMGEGGEQLHLCQPERCQYLGAARCRLHLEHHAL